MGSGLEKVRGHSDIADSRIVFGGFLERRGFIEEAEEAVLFGFFPDCGFFCGERFGFLLFGFLGAGAESAVAARERGFPVVVGVDLAAAGWARPRGGLPPALGLLLLLALPFPLSITLGAALSSR